MPDYTEEDLEILASGSWTDKDGTVLPFLATNRYGEGCPSVDGISFAIIDALHEVKKFTPLALSEFGMHAEQICQVIHGDVTPALTAYISTCLSVAHTGSVQRRLAGKGLVLCGGRVRREFTYVDESGEESTREQTVSVRVISKNADLVRALYLDPIIDRRERQAETERENAAMVAIRVKGLKGYIDTEYPDRIIESYQRGWGRELTAGTGGGTGTGDGADDVLDDEEDES